MTTVETRYFRQDKALGTVNTTTLLAYGATDVLGVDICHVTSSDVEDTIASKVAQATATGSGEFDSSYTFPSPHSIDPTDHIRIKIFSWNGSIWTLIDTWNSEDLGATTVSGTWTFHYWFYWNARLLEWNFRTGSATYNSRITGFEWDTTVTEEPISSGILLTLGLQTYAVA